MQKENLDDYELSYIDFYSEIPQADADYLNQIHPGIDDHPDETTESTGLSDEQVRGLLKDSRDAAAKEPQPGVTDEDGLFSSDSEA